VEEEAQTTLEGIKKIVLYTIRELQIKHLQKVGGRNEN